MSPGNESGSPRRKASYIFFPNYQKIPDGIGGGLNDFLPVCLTIMCYAIDAKDENKVSRVLQFMPQVGIPCHSVHLVPCVYCI